MVAKAIHLKFKPTYQWVTLCGAEAGSDNPPTDDITKVTCKRCLKRAPMKKVPNKLKPADYLINTVAGLQGERGVFYDYIMTSGGLYLQAKNAHLAATICIAPQVVRGLATIEESVHLLHGKIPLYLLNLALSVLCVKPDIEQYAAIAWNDMYTVVVPPQHSQSAASVTYEPVPNTVLGIHSHGAGIASFFSGVDDHDEQGFCLYAVAGGLQNLCPTMFLRLGVYGYFMELEREDVFV